MYVPAHFAGDLDQIATFVSQAGAADLVTHIEAKDKLSQNRGAADRAAVISALGSEPDPGAPAIAELMESREGTAR